MAVSKKDCLKNNASAPVSQLNNYVPICVATKILGMEKSSIKHIGRCSKIFHGIGLQLMLTAKNTRVAKWAFQGHSKANVFHF